MEAQAWVTLGVGLVGVVSGVGAQLVTFGYFKGRIQARMDATDKNIDEIKTEQGQQWSKIHETAEQVAALSAITRKGNGHAHFAGGD